MVLISRNQGAKCCNSKAERKLGKKFTGRSWQQFPEAEHVTCHWSRQAVLATADSFLLLEKGSEDSASMFPQKPALLPHIPRPGTGAVLGWPASHLRSMSNRITTFGTRGQGHEVVFFFSWLLSDSGLLALLSMSDLFLLEWNVLFNLKWSVLIGWICGNISVWDGSKTITTNFFFLLATEPKKFNYLHSFCFNISCRGTW